MNEQGHETVNQVDEPVVQTDRGGFAALGIRQAFCDTLREWAISEPAVVQKKSIPELLAGRDAVIESGTGTGKTLAYLLPMLERLEQDSKKLQGLVIVPTQELAMQIVRQAEGLIGSGRTAALIGGASLKRQMDRLKGGPVVAVGTPGRLAELLRLGKLKPGHIRMAVVDEADQVFALGEAGQASEVLSALPKKRQLVFVSATVTPETAKEADKWMADPLRISGQSQADVFAAVNHEFTVCQQREKIDVIRRFMRTVKPKAALLFVGDSGRIGEIEAKLKYAGLAAESLYSDTGKQERANVMRRLAAGSVQIVIATDLAARGLDVPHLTHVLQYEPPIDAKTYLHRAGRTGRMGRSGTVITLVAPSELGLLRRLGKKLQLSLSEMTLSHGKWVAVKEGDDVKSPVRPAEQGKAGGPKRAGQSAVARNGVGRADGDPSAAARSAADRTVSKSDSARDGHARGSTGNRSKKQGPRARDRKRDTKNKGAPRWLKEKQKRDET